MWIAQLSAILALVYAIVFIFRALGRDVDDAALRSNANKLHVEELSQERGEEVFRADDTTPR